MTTATQHTNRLINESSPYLLQHAHNPVDWFPWGKEALDKASAEDKPIIVSIGYSACHWCNVMERECFEKEDIAQIMNEKFVCIKVDREERPDIDQIYMDSVQAMGVQGGWPLNVFLNSGAKPFYGGTYFPPQNWVQVLNNVSNAYRTHREDIDESAEKFTDYLTISSTEKYKLKPSENFSLENLMKAFTTLSHGFDKELGGMDRAPKFPMPAIYLFLLRYYILSGDETALNQVKLTLDKMAAGGIYDQVGGGFARYSVDREWFAPHFEKMLYDNAQLISLYSEAYTVTKIDRYKEVVAETIAFAERELMNEEGGFYSALDADSEGIEGKFYIWEKPELEELLGTDLELFSQYYNVREEGNWDHNYNILITEVSDDTFARFHHLSEDELKEKILNWKSTLMNARANRIRPGLDDKILTSWNGLMLKGLCDAYAAFGNDKFLELAVKNAEFIHAKLKKGEQIWHSYKSGKASIDGYLEDYAAVIQGYLALYQSAFDEKWLIEADKLAKYVINHFYDPAEDLFFFTDDSSEKLIARKKEVFDNVIPASNSMMGVNLHFLGLIMDNSQYSEISTKMLAKVAQMVPTDTGFLSNWACLYSYKIISTLEIAMVGKQVREKKKELDKVYIPNKIVLGTEEKSTLPLLEDRSSIDGKTTIYVCFNKTCKLPVFSVEKAIEQIQHAG